MVNSWSDKNVHLLNCFGGVQVANCVLSGSCSLKKKKKSKHSKSLSIWFEKVIIFGLFRLETCWIERVCCEIYTVSYSVSQIHSQANRLEISAMHLDLFKCIVKTNLESKFWNPKLYVHMRFADWLKGWEPKILISKLSIWKALSTCEFFCITQSHTSHLEWVW